MQTFSIELPRHVHVDITARDWYSALVLIDAAFDPLLMRNNMEDPQHLLGEVRDEPDRCSLCGEPLLPDHLALHLRMDGARLHYFYCARCEQQLNQRLAQ